MNRIYKVIWSKVKHQYVVVSELAHSCTKSTSSRVGRSAAAVLAALVLTTGLCAAPVQAEDLTDPYALLNAQVEETNSTSSDTLVTLVQSPLVKSVAPLANEDEGQPGEGGSSTVTTPDGQHTIYNEEGFYAHNGQGTYNSLTKDGLFVGGTDNGEGLYVDNDGNIYTDGNAEIEGSFSAADGNATIAADGTTVIRAGGSQLVVNDGAAGITHGNAIMAVSSNKAEMQGGGSSVIADLNGVTLTERTGNTTVTVNQDGMTVDGDFAVTGNTNLKHTNVDGDLNVSGSTHVDGGLTAGNLQTKGQLHAGSAVIDGSATVGGKLTAGDVKTNTVDAHNVSVDNELTAGKATIDGKLTAGSAEITNSATVGGTLTAGDIETEGTVKATNADITNLEAGKATVEGKLTAGSADITGDAVVGGSLTAGSLSTEGKLTAGSAAINGNADITGTATVGGLTTEGKVTANNAEITNLKAGKADVEGIVRGGSFANTNDSFTVDDQGDVKAHNVTLTGTLGVAGATTLDSTLSVTGETTLTGALTANGTATFAKGASMGGQKITNVGDGEVSATSKDAVNGSQLQKVADTVKTYQAGDGIAIANGATQTPTISAKAADGGNIVVNADGISLAKDVSGLTSLGTDALTVNNNATIGGTLGVTGETTLTGALKANGTATFAQGASMGGQKITNVGDGEVSATSKDAVNGSQLQKVADTVKTYQAGDGIAIANGATQTPTISAKAADGGNIVVNADGISLAKDVSGLTSLGTDALTVNNNATIGGTLGVTGETTLTGALTANGTATFAKGASMGGQKITNVGDGEVSATSKDAVNGSQLQKVADTVKTYQAGDGIAIANGATQTPTISAKAADGGNIVVNADGISLAKDVSGLTSLGTNALTVNNNATIGGTLGVTGETTLTGALTANGTATFAKGASMGGQKITNVGDGEVSATSKDAVNGSQLQKVADTVKTYQAGDGIAIANGATQTPTISAKAADGGNIVVNADGISLSKTVSGLTSIGTETITANGAAKVGSLTTTGAISGGSVTAGTGLFSTSVTIGNTASGLKLADGEITGLATSKIDASTDAVNVEYLQDYVSKNGTGKTYTAGNGIVIDGSNVVSVKNGNGIGFDASGKVEVKAAQDGNIVVGTDGVSLSKTVSGLTSLSTDALAVTNNATVRGTLGVTGGISGGSVTAETGLFSTSVTIGNATSGLKLADGEITGLVTSKIDSNTDAVNVEYLEDYVSQNGTGKTYTAGNGIAIDNNKISVKTAADGNLEVDSNGVALKDAISLTSVTTRGAVTVGGTLGVTGATNLNSTLNVTGATTLGALTTNGTATFSQGASMNGQKITRVQAGTEGTDAVNRSQLDAVEGKIKTYTAGDGIDITSDKISVKSADNNIVVDGTGVSLADDISVTSVATTGAANVGGNLSVAGTTTLTGATTINSTLGVTGAVTAASVTAAGGFTINDSNSLTLSGLTIGGTQYITSAGLNAGNKVITDVKAGVDDNDAVNVSQLKEVKEVSDLAVTYTPNTNKSQVYLQGTNGTTIMNVAAGNISSADSKDAVNGGQLYATNQIVGDGDYSSNNFLTDSMNLTQAASALDKAIGANRYTDGNILDVNSDGKTYTSITAAVDTLNRSIGSLTMTSPAAYFSENSTLPSVTFGLNELSKAIGPLDFDGRNFISNDGNLSSALVQLDSQIGLSLESIGFRKDSTGHITTSIDWTGFNYAGKTVVDTLKNLDKNVYNLDHRVGVLENEHGISSNAISALSTFSTSNISTLSALSNMDMSAVNTLSSLSADDLAAISTLSEDGSVPAANSDPNSRPGRGPSSGSEDSSTHDGNTQVMDHNLAVTGNVSVGGTLDVTGKATFGSDVSVGGNLDVQGETNMHGTLNMNDNKITGVTAGDISADSTDAVNGSQLHDAWQQINSNTENIGILGSAVNKLGDRIERVGAGAAALAALHPLDFDPDNKLDFAAGFGNYRGASAVAVGAFYRPSENVMFSVGGAFGGGEDMVNAGVSFKVGAGSGSATTSRTAMAKSLKSMQEVVASQDA
ncbi:ESPR-type extended signal peptide-containing protein [Megasphaera stantonii]|nr:ESPR-type extended signal peptide-containing protein [Megasphaera stantonii]